MELYLTLYNIYKRQAITLLEIEGIDNPLEEQIQAYIMKCCVYEIILKKNI